MTEENGIIIMERDCPVCGKHYIVPDADAWVYKKGKLRFCSWGCMRKYEGVALKKRDYRSMM